jgi:formate dehydrogenase major subunit
VSPQGQGRPVKYVEGINGPANEGRLCVKGRFGFDYIHHDHRLTKPLIRRDDAPAKGLNVDPGNWQTISARRLGRGAGCRRRGRRLKGRGREVAGFGSAKCTNEEAYLFQKLIRRALATTTSITARGCATPPRSRR